MFIEIERLLKEETNRVVFIEMKEGKSFTFRNATLEPGLPIPMELDEVLQKASKVDLSSDLKVSSIVNGMAIILGADSHFPYKDAYIRFLMGMDEKMGEKILHNGFACAEKKQYMNAVLFFRAAHVLLGNDLNVLYAYAKCCEDLSVTNSHDKEAEKLFLKEAFDVFEFLKTTYPESPYAYYHLGFHYSHQKSYSAAEQMWKMALKLGMPDDKKPEIMERLEAIEDKVSYEEGYQLILEGFSDEGLVKLLPLVEMHPDWWNLHFFIGVAYRQMEDYTLALEYFDRVLNINTGQIETMNEVGLCYMALELYEQSVKYFKEAIKMSPKNSELLCNLAIAHLYSGEDKLAKETIERARQENPEDEIAIQWESIILSQMESEY